jgi:hypothetical protein
MKISGHKTRAVFDRYNIVNKEDIKAACERLSNAHEATKENTERAQNPIKKARIGSWWKIGRP